ncbi:MAG: hypothetical protein ACTSQI_13160 [Candidatus Helarchaeota archaeon]
MCLYVNVEFNFNQLGNFVLDGLEGIPEFERLKCISRGVAEVCHGKDARFIHPLLYNGKINIAHLALL